ncbi:MAG: hypothetical protein US02_C0010G0006 [Candidatus Levybacteria bacterium GW2011_GWA2_36_13]|nr:MAG: hypothetical protein US02_C0010G0006 [Candidatus Levybacteria bacterium GW2011_GWA2_36_13]
MQTLVFIVISSLIVYFFIITAIRIFGKRELSQLSVIDLVFILLISNAVQNAMVGGDINFLTGGIVAAFTLFAVNYLMGELFFKSKRLSKLIQGEPLMLIYKGKLIPAHLKKARISDDELEAAIREHGIEKISQVNLAVLERDGNISVLSNNFRRKTIKKRKSRQILFQDED